MYRGHRVGVVVPAYNEAGFVGDVISTVPAFVDRVYAVDDASTDGTWAEIRAAAGRENAAAEPASATAPPQAERSLSAAAVTALPSTDGGVGYGRQVVPVRHENNRGVGASITTGYRLALADGMDVIAVMNGDGQMDPAILGRILDPVVDGEADYAKGNRLASPEYREAMSRWRLFGNAVLTGLTKVASGYWGMMDPQNGYTAISASAIERIDLDAAYDDYGFCNDLLVRLNVRGCRIADVDMPAVYGDEQSHIRYSRFVPKLSWLLLRRFLWRLGSKPHYYPLVALYVLGAVGLVATAAYGGWALADLGRRIIHVGFAATGLLSAATLVAVAMTLDMLANRDLEVGR